MTFIKKDCRTLYKSTLSDMLGRFHIAKKLGEAVDEVRRQEAALKFALSSGPA